MSTEILFIADLHLSAQRPHLVEIFIDFLNNRARDAQTLYILGDLFDTWIGDDDNRDPNPAIRNAMQDFSKAHELYIQHGNRDFLLGQLFCQQTGSQLLDEEVVIDLFGKTTLLMHGDNLCTDDKAYQDVRKRLRVPEAVKSFLSKSFEAREQLATEYRRQSNEATSLLSDEIMDVNQQTVENKMQEHGVTCLIHGHTHRPGSHRFRLGNQMAERLVLADWRESGSALSVTKKQTISITL